MRMKPLYLQGTEPLAVALDGPALRVSQAGCAIRRFPLQRISRVVASGQVTWTTNALLACADEGIAVCFLTARGTPRARWIGRATKRSELAQRWQDFLDRPDWQDLHKSWRIASSRRAVRICAWRMGWSPERDPRPMHLVICEATRSIVGMEALRTTGRRLFGLAQTRAIEELTRVGLNAQDDALIYLVPDLVTSIQWGLRPELTRWLADQRRCGGNGHRQPTGTTPDPRAITRFLQRCSGLVDFHLRDTLGRLHPSLTLAHTFVGGTCGAGSGNQDVAMLGTGYRRQIHRYMYGMRSPCMSLSVHVRLRTCICASPSRSAPTARC